MTNDVYFGFPEADAALIAWAEHPLLYKFQDSEKELFFEAIRAYFNAVRQVKEPSHREFWTQAVKAARERQSIQPDILDEVLLRSYFYPCIAYFGYEEIMAEDGT
jgi:hypothetical protein